MKGLIIALLERLLHPLATLAIDAPQSRLNDPPFALTEPYRAKAPSCLFELQLDLLHCLGHLDAMLVIAAKTSEHGSHGHRSRPLENGSVASVCRATSESRDEERRRLASLKRPFSRWKAVSLIHRPNQAQQRAQSFIVTRTKCTFFA